MNARSRDAATGWRTFVFACAVVAGLTGSGISQTAQRTNRITQEVGAGESVTIAGSVHPLTRRATEVGAVDPGMEMDGLTLNTGLSAAQQKEMDALLEAQQTPGSAQYHRWLTQEEFGARFGLTDADLGKVKGWLASHGLTVERVANSRNAIYFSGNAAQVESAFHTQLRQYRLEGETHFANATEIQVPAGIASVLLNVRGLNNFRLKPNVHRATTRAKAEFTYEFGVSFLTPGDWATIYDVLPIYNAGYDGTGASLGVVGQTYVPQADIDNFRKAAGLPETKLTYVCIDPVSANCTGTAAISTEGDLDEADLDIEWSGGVAKNATVFFVYAPYSDVNRKTNPLGVFDALQYAVESYRIPGTGAVLPVISMSYTDCEANLYGSTGALDTGYYNYVVSIGQQANSQGQTIVVASGDSGAAGCDAQGEAADVPAKDGAWVSVPDDSPNYTAVGGTTLSGDEINPGEFWIETPDQVVTALQYIPETAWNETSTEGLAASGGGVSAVFPQPGWQQTPSGYAGPSGRFVPDVSFAAASGHDGYMYCSQDNNSSAHGTMCANGFWSSGGSDGEVFYVVGGTSASTPSFAGTLTLLMQKYGPQGNVNPSLYNMALNATTYSTVFHDITSGSNVVPCVAGTKGCANGELGWYASAGYDLATGLGSLDGWELYEAMGAPALPATTTSVTVSANSLYLGQTATLTANVDSTAAGAISGSVTFKVAGNAIGTAPLVGGTATLSVAVSGANQFCVGANPITAVFGGDTDFAASFGETTLTVAPPQATTATLIATPSSLMAGGTTTLTAQVTSTGTGTITGMVTFSTAQSVILGTVAVVNGTATLSNLTANTAHALPPGNDTITASYSGDTNFAASCGTTTLTVTAIPTTTALSVTPGSVMINNGTISLTVTVSAVGTPPANGFGSVWFRAGAYYLGAVTVPASGTATLSNVLATSSGGFVVGSNTITASYSVNGDYAGSSGSASLTATPQPASATTLAVTPPSVTVGGTVTLTAGVTTATGGTATGTVGFAVNGYYAGCNSLSSGTASLTNLPVIAANGFKGGANLITATYSGDSNFAGSTSAAATVNVTLLPSTTVLTVSPTSVSYGNVLGMYTTISASPGAAAAPTGIMTLTVGGTTISQYYMSGYLTTKGIMVSPATGFIAGQNTVTASYSGDGNYAGSSGSVVVTASVAPGYSVTPSATSVTIAPGGSAQVGLSLTATYYMGAVNFAVSCNSPAISASVSPKYTAGNTSTLTITAAASAAKRAPGLPWRSGSAMFCAVLLGAPLARRKRRTMLAVLTAAAAIMLVGQIAACGGGGASTTNPKAATGPQSYTVTLTPTGAPAGENPAPFTIAVTVQ